MAWTDTARRQHMRNGPGYPSDLRDGEWALIEPMLPPARSGGRPRTTRLRAVMDAILYIASSGCAWRMLPKCFPPISTVRGYFYDWRDSGLLTTINCGKRAGVPTEVADKVKALEREIRDLRQVTGEERIIGGRASLRRAIYMPALVAIRFNRDLCEKYHQLVSAGKAKKSAIAAVMRRIVILANTLLRDGRN